MRDGELRAEAAFGHKGKRVTVAKVTDGVGRTVVEVTTTHIAA